MERNRKYLKNMSQALFLGQLHKVISSKSSFVFNQYTHVKSYGT